MSGVNLYGKSKPDPIPLLHRVADLPGLGSGSAVRSQAKRYEWWPTIRSSGRIFGGIR